MTETSSDAGSSTNVQTVGQKRFVIVGATGMVGGYALRDSLEHPAVGTVTAIGRKKLGISHPKLKEVLHQDFADCSALAGELSAQDAAVFCLGTYARPGTNYRLVRCIWQILRLRLRCPGQGSKGAVARSAFFSRLKRLVEPTSAST